MDVSDRLHDGEPVTALIRPPARVFGIGAAVVGVVGSRWGAKHEDTGGRSYGSEKAGGVFVLAVRGGILTEPRKNVCARYPLRCAKCCNACSTDWNATSICGGNDA